MARYSYIWEFHVQPDQQTEFERHYGPDGSWVMLFRQSADYIETLLLHDRSHPLRYLTIDRWMSIEAYRTFRERYSREYGELDRLCQDLTTREVALGEYAG